MGTILSNLLSCHSRHQRQHECQEELPSAVQDAVLLIPNCRAERLLILTPPEIERPIGGRVRGAS